MSGVVATITVLFLTLFLLLELPALAEGLLRFVPAERAEQIRRVGGDINRNVAGYVLGNLIISVVAGTVVGISLGILGVPYALALAVLMGVFDLVPLVGATVGALAAIGVAFATQGVTAGIVMIVVNVVYQQIENHVLQPIVYRRTVQLSAFLILVAVLIGGELLGVLGALIAIPVAGSLQLLFRERDRREHCSRRRPSAPRHSRGIRSCPRPARRARPGAHVADRDPDRVAVADPGVRDEGLAAAVDALDQLGVEPLQLGLVVDALGVAAEADRRERRRREPLPAGLGVDPAAQLGAISTWPPMIRRSPSAP